MDLTMDLTKLTKHELIIKCQEIGIEKCKSKNKEQLINLLTNNTQAKTCIKETIKSEENTIKSEENTIKSEENTIKSEENTIKSEEKTIESDEEKTIKSSELIIDNEKIKLYKGDCRQMLEHVEDKSIQLICIDPPYNIGKDSWDNISDYNNYMMTIIKILEKKLKDNGSFFMFHNNMEMISELMVSIKKETKFVFKQMIVWNKRFDDSPKKGFMDGFVVKNEMHNFNKMAEYILFYTFSNFHKLEIKRSELKVSQLTISQEIKSKTGGLTGWYSNIETGKNMPTRETIKPIEKHLGLSYEDIVPKFINMKTHHSVWNYDMAKRCKVHITPKPQDLLKNIINHTTNEGDIILDCFAGSGTMGYASLESNRKCILIERESKYISYIVEEIKNMLNAKTLNMPKKN